MQFPVPQFIDIEDKLIGPFSLKQFGFIFTGGLIIVGLFRVLHLSLIFILLSLPIAFVSLFMAFGRFNGRRIYDSIPIFMEFFTAPKNLIFQKKSNIDDLHIQPISVIQAQSQSQAQTPELVEAPQSKLKRLSRMLEQKNAEEEEIVRESLRRQR